MNRSIISNERECFLCGNVRALEKHHVFGGANRKKSDKQGLWVWLCHWCHNEPPNGVHHNKERMDSLRSFAEARWIEFNNSDIEGFIAEFGYNYIW